MFKTYLYIVFCQKLKIGKNYFLSHFGHYLISACRDTPGLVRWVTLMQPASSGIDMSTILMLKLNLLSSTPVKYKKIRKQLLSLSTNGNHTQVTVADRGFRQLKAEHSSSSLSFKAFLVFLFIFCCFAFRSPTVTDTKFLSLLIKYHLHLTDLQ